MSIERLKAKIKATANAKKQTIQETWDKYFFYHFLIRLSKSSENSNFILKGGFLLESIVGIKNRTTLDLDFSYRLTNMNQNVIKDKIIFFYHFSVYYYRMVI
ncbi:MAG: nucleotidyl transferase AbiEii/AbiGii toxin family protein, partial [Bacilli bacterium]